MSLRWSSYVAPKSSKGGLKNARRPISVKKIVLRLKKVCYKVSLCENCQRQSCKAFIGLTNRPKMIGGGRALLPVILNQSDRVGAKSPTFDVFSLVATQPWHLAKKVQLTLIGSPLNAFQWAQDEHRTLFLSPQRVAGKRKVSEIWTISCDNSETVRDMMSVTINH